MLKIRRSKPVDNFTILPNALLRDDRLTYCARGVLAELLSRPSGWETNADALSERARRHRGDVVGEGRRGLRAAFTELEAAGYIVRRREQASKGRFITVLEVYDIPQDRGTARGTSADGTSASVTSAGGTSSVSTDGGRTDEEDAGEEHSSALAGARAGQQAGPQDRRREQLNRLYEAANDLDDDQLRRLLLQFEKKRPRIYREQRQSALAQLERESPEILRTANSVRAVDLLSFKYALMHYQEPGIPEWLRRFPQPR
ncbi:hypothetical protein [Streptomyces natalensis]|uniref:hypothetical protein n=1 Tax=Streptomyces natalensis TaxID=68242 RepID=UPI0004AAEABD|nr:hypothetical protein [Streptomyces natalensis]